MPSLDREACCLGESGARCNADAENHEVRRQQCSVVELDASIADGFRGRAEMEADAVLFVKLPHETTDRVANHACERHFVDAHDVDFDLPGAQRGRHFQADEARADDHGPRALLGPCDDCARVGERSQHVDGFCPLRLESGACVALRRSRAAARRTSSFLPLFRVKVLPAVSMLVAPSPTEKSMFISR